jgi:hypothetical protein
MVDLVCGSLILEDLEGCNIAQSRPSSSNKYRGMKVDM